MPSIVRKVVFPSNVDFQSYEDWQAWYLDKGCLIPDTELWTGDTLRLKINSLGCKGEDINASLPTAAFLGDSTTFGVSFSCESWPQHVRLDMTQVLNCGVEGWCMKRCLERYRKFLDRVNIAAAVVYVGWHNIIYYRTDEQFWNEVLSQFRGPHLTAYCSLATCLIDECREKGMAQLLCSGVPRKDYANYFEYHARSMEKSYFNFWCNMDPTMENIRAILDNVRRYNDFLKNFCRANGHVFIDLATFLKPTSYEHIPDDFFDVCHFRPRAYPKIADFVSKTLREPLQEYYKSHPQFSIGRGGEIHGPVSETEDLRKNIYPLW